MNNINDLLNSLNNSPEYNDFHSNNTLTMGEIIEKGYDWGRSKYYPKWSEDNENRVRLNSKIEDHYYFRDICATPISRWSHYMVRTLNEVLPKYDLIYTLIERDLDKLLIWRDKLNIELKKHVEETSTIKDTNTTEDTNIVGSEDKNLSSEEIKNTDTTSKNEEQNLHADVDLEDNDKLSQLSGADTTDELNEKSLSENTDKHEKNRQIDSKYPQAMLNGSEDYASNGKDVESVYEDEHTSNSNGSTNTQTSYGKGEEVLEENVKTNLGGFITNDDGIENTSSIDNILSSYDLNNTTDKNTIVADLMNMLENNKSNDIKISNEYGNILDKWLLIIEKYEDTDKLVINELEKCFSSIIVNFPNGGY